MERGSADGIETYVFEGLNGSKRVVHAVYTRIGGVSVEPYASLNLGHTVGDDPGAVRENHLRAAGALGLAARQFVSPYQVHGARVRVVDRGHLGTVQTATDALVTPASGVALLLRFADCASVVFFDRVRGVVGIAHAGWRGVAAGVVKETVSVLVNRLGCDPRDVWAGIGPTIGACCYEVKPDVAARVQAACPAEIDVVREAHGQKTLDIPGAVRAQLLSVGVSRIENSGLCTACHLDQFYSHRAENGRTGRFGVAIGLRA